MKSPKDAYHELCCYTLTHVDPAFIHQHVVDAFAAQDASEDDKPIRLTFALVGLFLHVEKNFTGRQVQLAHMKLGKCKAQWPRFQLPRDRGKVSALDVLEAKAGLERDQRIHEWCVAVWSVFAANRESIESLLRQNKILG